MPDTATRKSLERATSRYAEALAESPALGYLTGRGISRQTAAYFRLGYVEDPLPGHEWYKGRLSIPYLTPRGVVSIKFRATDNEDGGKKYLALPGDLGQSRPFNTIDLARPEGFLVVCEGELDCIIAHQVGLPAVGFPGSESWKTLYRRMLRWRRIAILADGDSAGAEFAKQVAKDVSGATIIQMPPGHDVNSFYQEFGAEGLLKKIGYKRGDKDEGLGAEGDVAERDVSGTGDGETSVRPDAPEGDPIQRATPHEVCSTDVEGCGEVCAQELREG